MFTSGLSRQTRQKKPGTTPDAHNELIESVSEGATHSTIEKKVNRVVDEREHVGEVAERRVDAVVERVALERLAVYDREEHEYGLREFGDEEEYAHDDEHECRAQVLFRFVALRLYHCCVRHRF